MVYIEAKSTDAAFHFSIEEYITRRYPWGERVMMIWQADKCVMIGNNQIAEAEVDMGYARENGIQVVRRSSGGGAIYTDLGTLLFTMIQPHTTGRYPLDLAKEEVAAPVVDALIKMGVPAALEGRNDMLVDGKKVSGLAQYVRHGRVCTHGSLLYNADLEMLARVLSVDDEKISSKALKSVRSRVANLKGYMSRDFSALEFREQLKHHLFSCRDVRELELEWHDLGEVDQIYLEKYGNPSWTLGQSPKFSLHNGKRFPGGRVEVYLDAVKGAVSSCSIRGDFLGVAPIQGLEAALEGIPFEYHAFVKALEGITIAPYLGGITKDELLSCIFG